MASAVDRPQAQNRCDVIFTYGNPPLQVRFHNGTDFFPGFVDVPSMAFKFPPNTADLSEGELQIEIPIIAGKTETYLRRITSGIALPPTLVEVRETVPSLVIGDTASNAVLFRGYLDTAELHPEDRTNIVRIVAVPVKNMLKGKTGLQCNVTCEWRVFGRGCATGDGFGGVGSEGPQWGLESRLMGVASQLGRTITVTAGWTTIDPNKTFIRGYFGFGGLNIDIQGWSVATPNLFILDKPAPADWVGQTVRAFPGCDLTKEHCLSAWNNLKRIGAFGYSMPDYSPDLEQE